MNRRILGVAARFWRACVVAAFCGGFVTACGTAPEISPADQPLSKDAQMLLGKKGMDAGAPIFVRIFKEESELEVWKARDDGRFYHFKTYPICNWSGDLGPKEQQGDKQAPEGFYTVTTSQLNPKSQFHVAFNLGYPNAYDRVHNRTGEFLMVHGKCKSAGCYAMTDALMEEIYGLAREAVKAGQPSFEVHAFPFRMTGENMARFKQHKWYSFWQIMKQGYDHFEVHRVPPAVAVCERRYIVNVVMPADARIEPDRRCPRFQRPQLAPFTPKPAEQQIAEERISVPGPKMRSLAANSLPQENLASGPATAFGPTMSGLGGSGLPVSGTAAGFTQ